MPALPRLALTPGEPAGIGPDLCVQIAQGPLAAEQVAVADRKLLQEYPVCSEFRIMDDISFGRIHKQVGLYYRAGRQPSHSAGNFINLCERFWNL